MLNVLANLIASTSLLAGAGTAEWIDETRVKTTKTHVYERGFEIDDTALDALASNACQERGKSIATKEGETMVLTRTIGTTPEGNVKVDITATYVCS